MKEYTILAAFSVILTIAIDMIAKTGILRRKEFYIFLLAVLGFKLLVNGYLTGAGIVLYNPQRYLGIRISSIPIEDFLFGFSMVTQAVIFWEYFLRREK
jgi:lycopene cyclase domain-containing protein